MVKTNYLWDEVSDNVIAEYESGVATAVYTQEPGLYGNLISQRRSGVSQFYHFDARGDTRNLTDASENVTDSKTYDAWGNVVASTGSTSTPFQFVGRKGYQADLATQCAFVRARQYHPLRGRWASLDPLGYIDGTNPYTYVGNRVIMADDPTGMLFSAIGPPITSSASRRRRRRAGRRCSRGRCNSECICVDPPNPPNPPNPPCQLCPPNPPDPPKPPVDNVPDPLPGGFACGLFWEHYADIRMFEKGWAPAFGHCYAHCMIAQNCPDPVDTSRAIGVYTESYQLAICMALISQVGLTCACFSGICRSAWQLSDFEDNDTGLNLGMGSPDGDCEAMCEGKLGGKEKNKPPLEEGPGKPRPYGGLCNTKAQGPVI